ncbi:hypothetical protein AXG93_1774s1210 [Marchantia polymorpha subsp. ruderalis]|uniref:Uncharacterized protein n=1 Tax=Marchantia polymorpha subsp. ruderalis TaxID=1480154 RepID=A0A176W354_MARPO|nr:hypothetical protein AXG93_1774s1210 [Marchantia polymorpha subsp. ruderalis]
MSLTGGRKEGHQAFARLRPLCTQLLEVSINSPEERGAVLDALLWVLRDIDPIGLQTCMDYVLLPLLLLLDGAVACRTSSAKEKSTSKAKIMIVGDRAAESVLSCVETVLHKCHVETREQMIMMLRKLTGGAMLSTSEASEEFRHGVLKCLKSFLTNLRPCSTASCMCQSVSVSPFEALDKKIWNLVKANIQNIDSIIDESDVCPMGFLQTESMAPAVGHLISLLLQIADAEASRGGVGSGKLRRDALSTLRLLFLKVGSADALAFFLPGAVRGLATVMRATKAQVNSGFSTPIVHVSGAAGWPAVVEEAVRGMAEILTIVMRDGQSSDSITTTDESATLDSALDYLQDLSLQFKKVSPTDEINRSNMEVSTLVVHKKKKNRGENESSMPEIGAGVRSFRTERDEKWQKEAAIRVHTFLSQTLPLECLLALACDEFEHVASAAQLYLSRLLGFQRSIWWDSKVERVDQSIDPIKVFRTLPNIMTDILSSLVEQLPKVIFSSNAAMAVSHGKRLAAAMYFSGPLVVSSCLLGTPIDRQRFTKVFTQCLGFSSAFTGSLGQIAANPSAHSPVVSEILPGRGKHNDSQKSVQESDASSGVQQELYLEGIPSMPPWLPVGTASRLYSVLADVLRLAGVSAISDQRNGTRFFGLVELLLVDIRLAATNRKMYNSDSRSMDFETGQRLRAAATSACVLNEIMYGASGKWNGKLFSKFQEQDSLKALQKPASQVDSSSSNNSSAEVEPAKRPYLMKETDAKHEAENSNHLPHQIGKWQGAKGEFVRKAITECAGDIIHDYLSTEIWDEPTHYTEKSVSAPGISSFNNDQDIVMLQKVLVEGVGVLGMSLGKAFEENGLLRLVLFPLLEKLASPNYYVSQAAAMSLNAIRFSCEARSVKDLVVANVDYVVDSLCRQFRHLKMHPRSLNMLAAILRHTNTAPDLLPLLGEPLQCLVVELDVMARTSHPQLTVPLLRAMREILRAASLEVDIMLSTSTNAAAMWRSMSKANESSSDTSLLKTSTKNFQDSDLEEEVDKFLDRVRHRHAILKVATSCVLACGPLLASEDIQICLFTLDVIADGISTLSDAEEAGRYDDASRQAMKDQCNLMDDPQSSMRCVDMITKDESETNKLLPTMHKIWKYLVVCLRQGRTPVVVRALDVMSLVTTKCGGEFFTRRLKHDVMPILVGHLSQGLMSTPSKRRSYPLIPHKYTHSQEHGPEAMLKVQHAVLKSISSIASDKKSAPALQSSFEVLASWVVVLACEVEALKVAATETALALSTLNSDFVWILVADLLSGVITEEFSQVTIPGFPDFNAMLPTWSCQADTLWCQYTAYRGEFRSVDRSAAQQLLSKLEGLPTTWTQA